MVKVAGTSITVVRTVVKGTSEISPSLRAMLAVKGVRGSIDPVESVGVVNGTVESRGTNEAIGISVVTTRTIEDAVSAVDITCTYRLRCDGRQLCAEHLSGRRSIDGKGWDLRWQGHDRRSSSHGDRRRKTYERRNRDNGINIKTR